MQVIGSIADHPTLKIRTDEKCFTLRTMVGGGILVFIGEHDDAELGRHSDISYPDTE